MTTTLETPVPPRLAPRPYDFRGYAVEAVLRAGSTHKARVLLAHRDGERVVIKDLSTMRPLFRALFGRRMLAREARALESLAGFEGTPRLVERVSKDAIAIEFFNAIYLRKSLAPERKPAVLRAFGRAVANLHRRGVVHLDLRQRKNVLVLQDDRVVLIDFESCLVFGTGPLGRLLTACFAPIDRSAVLKWQVRFAPKMVSSAQRERFERWQFVRHAWFFKRWARRVRTWFGAE